MTLLACTLYHLTVTVMSILVDLDVPRTTGRRGLVGHVLELGWFQHDHFILGAAVATKANLRKLGGRLYRGAKPFHPSNTLALHWVYCRIRLHS